MDKNQNASSNQNKNGLSKEKTNLDYNKQKQNPDHNDAQKR